MKETADICLFLEGTYPYLTGGVSTWAHDLIRGQSENTFYLMCLLPPNQKFKDRYEIPKNVVGRKNVILQELPNSKNSLGKVERELFFRKLEPLLLAIQRKGKISDLKLLIELVNEHKNCLDGKLLLESIEAWNMMVRMYLTTMGGSSFLNFFWSYRSLMGGLFSILLAPLPEAKVYHTFCTGFSGLFLARAFAETGRPCLTTEHGIYTNERRIEIASANWLDDMHSQNLSLDLNKFEKDIKDYWTDTFLSYSRLCYEASDAIITLHEGNKSFQVSDGADPNKLFIVPNGVDYDMYSQVCRDDNHPPTVALIGRVVPIKDIKSFIRSVGLLKESIPDLRAYILGPTDEDLEYFEECMDLIKKSELEDRITLTGKVNILEYLPIIDVVVLTSLSEGQPLTLLEAGAAGIPCVATNVGACHEIIYGRINSLMDSGDAGIVTPLANPVAISQAIEKLFTDKEFYIRCSETIRQRVKNFYHRDKQTETYRKIYQAALRQGEGHSDKLDKELALLID